MDCYRTPVVTQRGVFGTSLELRDANKTVSYSGTPEEIESECEALDALDKHTELAKTMAIVFGILAGLVTFVGFTSDIVWLTIVGLGGVGVAVFYVMTVKDDDIEDRKLFSAREILATLAPELRRGRPVRLDIDFRLYDNPSTDGVWMKLAGTLHDGTGVDLRISTHHKRKTRRKRKYTKIKDKLHERLVLTFTPPKGRRFDPDAQSRIAPAAISGLSLRGVKVSPKAAELQFSTPAMLRIRARGGWSDSGLTQLIGKREALFAVVAAYRALAQSGVAKGA